MKIVVASFEKQTFARISIMDSDSMLIIGQ